MPTPIPSPIGLDNYVEIVTDPLVWHSLRVTTVFALLSVPLTLALGLVLAMLLNQRVRGVAIWRTIYYLPAVVSGVAVALLWEWLFNGRFGLVDYLLELDDAARIDGCGVIRIYWNIIVPLSLPALATIAIFAFQNKWNQFFEPLIYINKVDSMPPGGRCADVPERGSDTRRHDR